MAGLTRMAKTPGRRIIYRTYLNDPWFEINPWMDIYNRETLELYTAMSAARLNESGGVDAPTDLPRNAPTPRGRSCGSIRSTSTTTC